MEELVPCNELLSRPSALKEQARQAGCLFLKITYTFRAPKTRGRRGSPWEIAHGHWAVWR